MAESSNDRVGQKISNYQLVRLIGHGGFADVYLGEHIYLKTLAAVKILHARTDAADQSDILNEARTIAQLEHPNIVRLFEYGIEDGYPFLVMSYAARGSLRNHYPKGSRLPIALVVNYVQQIASALDYAHKNRLIHRDVKPENMLIGQNEQLLLTDFGLVMMAPTSRSQSSDDLAGTVAYMAPEQLRGRPRFASDQYALGVVVYEWLCGRRPFTGSFGEIASQQMLELPPSLCALEPDLAPEVEQVVFRALAKNPSDRFASAGDFAHALSLAYGSPSQFTQGFPQVVPVSGQLLTPGSFEASAATRPSPRPDRLDPGETVEIPIDEAITSTYDAAAAEHTVQAMTIKQPQVLSTAVETITPDPVMQTFQLSPVIDAARIVPVRRDVKSMAILVILLLFVGGSIALGFSKFAYKPGMSISTSSGNKAPSVMATSEGTIVGTSTAGAVGAPGTVSPTTTPNLPAPNPVATAPALMQKAVPVPTPTSVPPIRVPTPTPIPPTPGPTPIQNVPPPVPTPDPNATPTPEATPEPNLTVPTPDPNMIPGLVQ